MNKISFVQVNFRQQFVKNNYYLPYSSGVLWSYCLTSNSIKDSLSLGEFIFRREEINDVAERLKDNKVIALSIYIWNRRYSLSLAKRLKELNPDIIIVAGGPELEVADINLFQSHPFIDFVVLNEGELTLTELLETLISTDFKKDWQVLKSVTGLLINKQKFAYSTGQRDRIQDLENLPSPYLTGVFDTLLANHPDIKWSVIMETNRGCPFHCTFCDWGSLTYNKVKKIGLDRIFSELEWCRDNKIVYIYFADANFGAFKRDASIIDKMIEVKKGSCLQSFVTSWHKNQQENITDIVSKLCKAELTKLTDGLIISVQTLTPHVLKNIKRENMGVNNIGDIISSCHRKGIPYRIEFISDLPGETVESWKSNYFKLYEHGLRDRMAVYFFMVLNNSEVTLTSKQNLVTKQVDYFSHEKDNNIETEVLNIVTAYNDRPVTDFIDGKIWDWFLYSTHGVGLTNIVSTFLYKKFGVEFKTFYDALFAHLMATPFWQNESKKIVAVFNEYILEQSKIFGGREKIEHQVKMTYFQMQLKNKIPEFYTELESFLTQFVTADIARSLCIAQRNFNISVKELTDYPRVIEINHNIYDATLGADLEEGNYKYTVESQVSVNEDLLGLLKQFIETPYYTKLRTRIYRENTDENIMRNFA